jgi:hypothetical protein
MDELQRLRAENKRLKKLIRELLGNLKMWIDDAATGYRAPSEPGPVTVKLLERAKKAGKAMREK